MLRGTLDACERNFLALDAGMAEGRVALEPAVHSGIDRAERWR
jgi:hypothetical protein